MGRLKNIRLREARWGWRRQRRMERLTRKRARKMINNLELKI